MPNLQIGSINLGEHDHDWYIVMSYLGVHKSLRGNTSSIVGYYIRRRKGEYVELLNYEAAKRGISPVELFNRILKNKNADTPLPEGYDTIPVPELSATVQTGVQIEIPASIYEQLRQDAEREGLTIAEIITLRLG